MKKITIAGLLTSIVFAIAACGGGENSNAAKSETSNTESAAPASTSSYDPHRGEGKFTKVDVPATLDKAMAANGSKIYGVKCGSCHKTTEEKLVGPGWKGVTSRNSAEWIMNFVTNTDEMLNKDPKAQAQLEICLVRMPNQNLSDDEARALYEYMREIDGVK